MWSGVPVRLRRKILFSSQYTRNRQSARGDKGGQQLLTTTITHSHTRAMCLCMTVSSTKQHSGPRPQVVRFEPSASPRARPRARWQCPRSYPQLLWNTYTRKNEDAQHDTTTTIHHFLRSSSMDHADVRMCRRRPERQTVAVCQLRHCGTAVMKTAHSGLLPSANTPAPPRPSHSPSPTMFSSCSVHTSAPKRFFYVIQKVKPQTCCF